MRCDEESGYKYMDSNDLFYDYGNLVLILVRLEQVLSLRKKVL